MENDFEKVIDNQMWSLQKELDNTNIQDAYPEYLYDLERFNIYFRNERNVKQIIISGSYSLCLGWLIGYKAGCDETLKTIPARRD